MQQATQRVVSQLFLLLVEKIILIAAVSGGFNDTVSCEDFPEKANLSTSQIEQETLRLGRCLPYTGGDFLRQVPCNEFFITNVDTYYLPYNRANNNPLFLNAYVADTSLVIDMLSPACREPAIRTLCYYFFPPCGNITHFEPPNAVCQDVCFNLANDICNKEWRQTVEFLMGFEDFLIRNMIQFINCSNPGASLDPLPYCCSDAGVVIEAIVENEVTDLPTFAPIPASTPTPQISVMILAVSISVGLLLVLSVCTAAIILAVFCGLKKTKQNNIILQFTDDSRKDIPEIKITSVDIPPNTPGMSRYNAPPTAEAVEMVPRRIRVNSGFIRHMSESELLIPGRHLKLLETVGQGEFGVVYRGHLTGWQERTTAELVAVKTLKSCFTVNDIEDLMKESEKMKRFDHPNVLGLIGVCIDSGEAPYVVMPFMANGSLLMYLKKERPKLTIAGDAGNQSMIEDAQRKLLSLCLQIANGMSYLAMEKFVHRDLAARNCMIDQNFVIKVADFGLSEDVYSRNYFRQVQGEEGSAIKLPIRWMALESLLDGVFTEKTDVWSYGVTCWEVFSLGHTPYPAVDPFSLMKFLRDGGRLEKPANAACSLQVYDLMYECWSEVSDKRPSFKDLVFSVNSLLEGVAGYLDFSAFSAESHWKGYDHLCRNDELDTYK